MGYFHRRTKRDFSQAKRGKLADTGAAMPDGSFPIVSGGDLENAIRLAGNAKDPDAARAHIKTRAKALGLSDKIPDTWTSKKDDTMKTEKQDLTGVSILFAPIFQTTRPVVGTDGAIVRAVDLASAGKLLNDGFPSESLVGVMKESFEKVMKLAPVAPADDTQPGAPAAPTDPSLANTKPAPKVTWAQRTDMAMQAKGKNTARPIDAVLPFMGGKFGLNLFQSTNVSPDDIPTILEALKQNGFTMTTPAPQDDGDGDGPDCFSFMGKDGTHVYMEVDMDEGSIAWVIETPDKEINVDGPAPTGDTRPVQSRFGMQQKRAKIAQQAAQGAQQAGSPQAALAQDPNQKKPGAQQQAYKQERLKRIWKGLKPVF